MGCVWRDGSGGACRHAEDMGVACGWLKLWVLMDIEMWGFLGKPEVGMIWDRTQWDCVYRLMAGVK